MSVNRISDEMVRRMNAVTEERILCNPVVLSSGRMDFEIRDADRVPSLTALIKRMQSGDKLPTAHRRVSTCPVCCGSGMQLLSYKFDTCPTCKGEWAKKRFASDF